jgi:hypothetical protein
VFTSIAGSLYSIKTGFIDPESGFGILVSVQMVIIAALGGAGRLFDPWSVRWSLFRCRRQLIPGSAAAARD